ncbi:putative entry exclusion protein TrbK-alt [Bradyrhizobium sp. Leo121]|uniref:putative entry exclusion protein TrbK-alt n=1 Tax=Bradyrhizobium sp. Leo121 TaxID=1571195 RepID=UPI001FDF7458|nr:putative entry exclusion protein TrbK-alt [Bradyrhizobium sp. Leo121]
MDGKTLARVGAIVFVAVAIAATAIEMNRKDVSTDVLATQDRPITARDPLASELLRCSEIGEAGTRDPNCLKAWAENRRRFLGRRPEFHHRRRLRRPRCFQVRPRRLIPSTKTVRQRA